MTAGLVPDSAPRAAVEVLLADSVSELAAHLAESKEPARVGRVRDPHVPHDLEHLPLHRVDSGHRDPARPREESGAQGDLRDARRSAGATRIASGGTSRARICSSPRSPRRSCSRCTRSCRSTSRWRSRRVGTRRSSRRTSSPARSSPASAWCSRSPSRCASAFKLEHYITLNDLDAAAKLCLFTSCVVGLAYLTEFQVAWMSGNQFEQDYFWNRVFGQWAWAAWIMLICNMVLPLSLWSQKLRRNPTLALHPVALHQPRHVVRAVRDRRAVALARVRAVAVGQRTARRGSTTAFCSAASAGSSCGSCCSSSSCP